MSNFTIYSLSAISWNHQSSPLPETNHRLVSSRKEKTKEEEEKRSKKERKEKKRKKNTKTSIKSDFYR
jgi:hypothetical protein